MAISSLTAVWAYLTTRDVVIPPSHSGRKSGCYTSRPPSSRPSRSPIVQNSSSDGSGWSAMKIATSAVKEEEEEGKERKRLSGSTLGDIEDWSWGTWCDAKKSCNIQKPAQILKSSERGVVFRAVVPTLLLKRDVVVREVIGASPERPLLVAKTPIHSSTSTTLSLSYGPSARLPQAQRSLQLQLVYLEPSWRIVKLVAKLNSDGTISFVEPTLAQIPFLDVDAECVMQKRGGAAYEETGMNPYSWETWISKEVGDKLGADVDVVDVGEGEEVDVSNQGTEVKGSKQEQEEEEKETPEQRKSWEIFKELDLSLLGGLKEGAHVNSPAHPRMTLVKEPNTLAPPPPPKRSSLMSVPVLRDTDGCGSGEKEREKEKKKVKRGMVRKIKKVVRTVKDCLRK